MRVAATQVGFYVKLRKPDDVFDVSADRFSSKWMRRIEEPEVEEVAEVPPPDSVAVETPPVEPVVKKRRGRKPKAVSE